jgi:hypothetical protein
LVEPRGSTQVAKDFGARALRDEELHRVWEVLVGAYEYLCAGQLLHFLLSYNKSQLFALSGEILELGYRLLTRQGSDDGM